MTYTKPRLIGYAAISAVQGMAKPGTPLEQSSQTIHTTPAYEADE